LIGRSLPENQLKIIALSENPIASLAETRELPPGEIGEIIVTGPTVTKEYDTLPTATALAKIQGIDGTVWHRMGDAGRLDATGRLWFCGRIAERVETAAGALHTEPCEQVFRTHWLVERCALIGLGPRGAQEPALVVQRRQLRSNPPVGNARMIQELRDLAIRHPHTAGIKKFFFHPAFPVDVRHNAKIHRLTLAQWAATARPETPADA
jgi:acyl-CoA synthetase (AMP-forming)/AMP-acid ligase II